MKINRMTGRIFLAVLAASGLTGAFAQTPYLNTFDSSASLGRFDFGGGGAEAVNSITFSALNASGGGVGSGSARLSWTWNGLSAGSAAFTFDTTFPATNDSLGTLSFDLRLDSSSTPGGFSDYGFFQMFVRNTDGYVSQDLGGGSGLISKVSALDTWTHINISLGANGSALRAITFQDFNSFGAGQRNINGPITIYIDNLAITPVPEPSTIALAGLGVAGLFAARRFRKIEA